MVDFGYFSTFSGILVFLAVFAAMHRRGTVSGLLLTVAGAGGVGVFWERWSRLTGDDVHVTALLHPVAPTFGEAALLVTHTALLAAGIVTVSICAARKSQGEVRA